jgi:hypothetical protein
MTTRETTILGGVGDRLSAEQRKELDEFLAKGPPPGVRLKRKAVLAEVSPRMHAAVKAKPEALRMIAEDASGNAVIERPYRPKAEAVITPDRTTIAVGGIKWGRSGFGPGLPQAPVWDVPGGRGDELVKHQYDIFAVLREDD